MALEKLSREKIRRGVKLVFDIQAVLCGNIEQRLDLVILLRVDHSCKMLVRLCTADRMYAKRVNLERLESFDPFYAQLVGMNDQKFAHISHLRKFSEFRQALFFEAFADRLRACRQQLLRPLSHRRVSRAFRAISPHREVPL